MKKVFRGKTLNIIVQNPDGEQGGFKEFYMNGEKLESNYILADRMLEDNEIIIVM